MDFEKGNKVLYMKEIWTVEWIFTRNVIVSRKRKSLKEELISSSTTKRDLKLKGIKCKTNYLYVEVPKTRIKTYNFKDITLNKLDESYR